jgi:hypothetical protein
MSSILIGLTGYIFDGDPLNMSLVILFAVTLGTIFTLRLLRFEYFVTLRVSDLEELARKGVKSYNPNLSTFILEEQKTMRRFGIYLFISSLAIFQLQEGKAYSIGAETTPTPPEKAQQVKSQKEQIVRSAAPFKSFTGKISKNKVRMRLQPNLEAPILKEFNRGDMLIVVGESDDFYAVQPQDNIKAFVYRTFVLDNAIEGSHVNIRLEPNLDAPVIAQLNSGDKVKGAVVSPLSSKWMEIAIPESTRFYVSKDFVENIGAPELLATLEKRKEEVNRLLDSTTQLSKSELQKPFEQINLQGVSDNFNKIITQYGDFADQVVKARDLLTSIQEQYLQKKIAYLESKNQSTAEVLQAHNMHLATQLEVQQGRLSELEKELENKNAPKPESVNDVTDKMSSWMPVEMALYQSWAENNSHRTAQEFYDEQKQNPITIVGIIEPYQRTIKNKPGDYLLLNQVSRLPIAYLYSTQINLESKVGQQVSMKVAPRSSNNFAYPAYFVLSIE